METYVVHVTKQCNLDCVYCYEQDKESTYSWGEVKAFIDELIHLRTSDVFSVEFLGGEPMLAFDLVQQAYEYLEAVPGISVQRYIITTNGTILDDGVIDFLKRNPKVQFAISMDGTRIANQLRVFKESRLNTYDAVCRTIRLLLEADLVPSVHMVTHPYNVFLIERSVKHLYDLGVMHIDLGIVESTVSIDQAFIEVYVAEAIKISDAIRAGKLPGLHVGVLEYLKPTEDVRTYLRDKVTGKLIAETYGRSGADVSMSDQYDVIRFENKTPETLLIEEARKRVYEYHNRR